VDKRIRSRIAALIVVAGVALTFFTRTPGADAVRWVQILLLFAAGMCAGVALTLFRVARQG